MITKVLHIAKGVTSTPKESLKNTSDPNDVSLTSGSQNIKCCKHLATVCREFKNGRVLVS